LEDFAKKIPATKEKEKNHAAYNREKKYAKESTQKKFLHVNLLTCSSLQYCVHRLARFCIFEQAHLLKRTRGEQWTTSQGFYRLWSL
jgi:hypothetical protein